MYMNVAFFHCFPTSNLWLTARWFAGGSRKIWTPYFQILAKSLGVRVAGVVHPGSVSIGRSSLVAFDLSGATGVPQGSVLGPLLYVLFTADVLQITGEAGVGVQQYADDTQTYQHCKPNNAVRAFTQLQTTLTKVQAWISSNRLKLNPRKTRYIWFGTRVQLAKIDKQELLQQFPGVVFHSSVVDLGVFIDEELKMDLHGGIMVRSCFYQLRQIRTIRQSLSDNATRTLIVTRVDYCNSVLSGVADRSSSANPQRCSTSSSLNAKIPSNFESDSRTIFTGCQQHNGRNSRHCCSLRTPSATGHLHICKNSLFLSLQCIVSLQCLYSASLVCMGRPKKRWLDNVREDCKILGLTVEEADQLARDRARWRSGVTRLLERADLSVSQEQ